MELNVLSVARRQAIIYQMCGSWPLYPQGPPGGFPTADTPRGPLQSPGGGQGLDSPQCFLCVRGGVWLCLFVGGAVLRENQ